LFVRLLVSVADVAPGSHAGISPLVSGRKDEDAPMFAAA
jgi:hypothetical protein